MTLSVPADRALHRLGLSRVVRPRLLVRLLARLRHGRGDGRHRRAEPADVGDQAALRPPRDADLRRARAVPALHPAGLGHRAVGQARAVRRDGARGGRRGGRRAPAVPLAEGLRPRVRRRHRGARGLDRARLRGREHVPVAGLRPRRRRCTCPGGTPRPSPTPTPPSTSPTPRSRSSDVVEMATRLGDRLRHIHLTDGTGSAKDEHLVPGRGAMGADRFLRHLATTGFAGEVVLEINTRKCADRAERERDLRRVAGVRPRAPGGGHAVSHPDRGRLAAGADPGPRTPGPRSWPRRASSSPPTASRVRRSARSPRRPASTRPWCTTTSAPRTTSSSPRSSSASTRGWRCCRWSRAASTARGSG